MTFLRLCAVFLCLVIAMPAMAENIDYISDPLYEPLGDTHPLEELFELAEDGDARAQYILGDLYGKGKGGVSQNIPLAKMLFAHSAKGGSGQALIRLAAIAKIEKDLTAAYQWYDLAVDHLDNGPTRDWAENQQDTLNEKLDRDQKRAAKNAAEGWEENDLTPLKLDHPLSPLGKKDKKATADTPPDNPAETDSQTKEKESTNEQD